MVDLDLNKIEDLFFKLRNFNTLDNDLDIKLKKKAASLEKNQITPTSKLLLSKIYHLLGLHYYHENYYIKSKKYFELGLDNTPKDSSQYITILLDLWTILSHLGKHKENYDLLNDIDVSIIESDDVIIGYEFHLAETLRSLQKFEKAKELFEKYINQLNSPNFNPKFLRFYGKYLEDMEELEEARKYYGKGQTIARDLKNSEEEGHNVLNIGNYYLDSGNFVDAQKFILNALDIFNKLGINGSIGDCYSNLGFLFDEIGNYPKAMRHYRKALEYYNHENNLLDIGDVHNNLGVMYENRGMIEESRLYYSEAKKAYEISEEYIDKGNIINNLANIEFMSGNLKEAENLYLKALEIYGNQPKEIEKVECYIQLGDIKREQSKYEQAQMYYQKSINIFNTSINKFDVATSLAKFAYSDYKLNNIILAKEGFTKSLAIAEANPNPYVSFKIFNDILQLNEEFALQEAINRHYGRLWIKSIVENKLSENLIIKGKWWRYLWSAANDFWTDMQKLISDNDDKDLLLSNIYLNHWKFKQIIDNLSRGITPETSYNFILGVNDLKTTKSRDISIIKDEQHKLDPMWFVEFPLHILHSDKYLKIRINNRILTKNGRTGFQSPYLSNSNIESINNRPIERIKVRIETQWLKLFDIDHIFLPNTQKEQEEFEDNPDNLLLSDVYLLDLENRIKREENLELSVNIKIGLTKNSEIFDISTTTKRIMVPIIRKRNFQLLEKKIIKNQNILALFLAVWSIITSLVINLIDILTILPWVEGSSLLNIINSILISFLFLIFIISIPMILPINKDDQSDTVSDY